MAFDGTTLAGIVHELSQKLVGGRVDKIAQPEPDEILISIRSGGTNYKIMLTANANAPRLGLTSQSKISPLKAPMFCMVLRKHISAGRITGIFQPDFERIVEIHIDAMDEMGDRSTKILLIEIMGKHSNIMLLDARQKVLDAIKHVAPSVSLVRPILPGVVYSRPPGKANPLSPRTLEDFKQKILPENPMIQKALYQRYSGISPILASEICARANVEPDSFVKDLCDDDFARVNNELADVMQQVAGGRFNFNIYFDETGKTVDLAALPLSLYAHHKDEPYESPSAMLEDFYTKRDNTYRVSQKTADLRKVITTHLERCQKKSIVFDKTLEDIKNRDQLRIKGELLTAYLHMLTALPKDAKTFIAHNYYDNSQLEIAIDPMLSPSENAQAYFKKYNKQKRTHSALQGQITSNDDDIMYLSSVLVSMETIADEADIEEIRAELASQGFVKRRSNKKDKKANQKASPLKYKSSDGFDIYVGKNNTQNDDLTLRFAARDDIWLHTKGIAGSHVIITTGGKEPPQATILEAANLAAYHSRAKNSSKVPVDYVAKKHVRKPSGAKPGFVIYDNHKTVYVTPVEPGGVEQG